MKPISLTGRLTFRDAYKPCPRKGITVAWYTGKLSVSLGDRDKETETERQRETEKLRGKEEGRD